MALLQLVFLISISTASQAKSPQDQLVRIRSAYDKVGVEFNVPFGWFRAMCGSSKAELACESSIEETGIVEFEECEADGTRCYAFTLGLEQLADLKGQPKEIARSRWRKGPYPSKVLKEGFIKNDGFDGSYQRIYEYEGKIPSFLNGSTVWEANFVSRKSKSAVTLYFSEFDKQARPQGSNTPKNLDRRKDFPIRFSEWKNVQNFEKILSTIRIVSEKK